MSIADDLRAAADKLDETRSGGDEVGIQCVEQLRRHADTLDALEKNMRAYWPMGIAWADALRGQS